MNNDISLKEMFESMDVPPSEYLDREKGNMRRYNNQLKLINGDMIDLKDAIKGTIYFKYLTKSLYEHIDADIEFDYWDFGLVKQLPVIPVDAKNVELSRLALEFNKAYEDIKKDLSDDEIFIIESYREDEKNRNMSACAERLDMTLSNIYKKVDRIIQLIQRKMIENYELDVYYTEKVKADWKKCSKCNESYPRNEYYWNKAKTGRDGFRGECKKCEAKRLKNS